MMIRLNNALVFIILKYVIIKTVCFSCLSWTSTGSSQWDVPWKLRKSENTETLYYLSALNEAVQIDYKKACSVMEQAWISTLSRQIC